MTAGEWLVLAISALQLSAGVAYALQHRPALALMWGALSVANGCMVYIARAGR